jgi:hypothetical protein
MKQLIAISVLSLLTLATYAQKDTLWKKSGFIGLNFNQSSFVNWAQGGQSNISGIAIFNYKFDYKKDKIEWKNELNMAYGTIKNFDIGSTNQIDNFWRKNEDRLLFESRYTKEAAGKWQYASIFTFYTQFDKGYLAPDFESQNFKSDFLAPAFATISLGMKYKPTSYFDVYFSPASGKFTYVRVQSLADQGLFGVKKADLDPVTNLPIAGTGSNFRPEFGASMILNFNKKELIKNIDVSSNLTLFNNYTDSRKENRKNIDIMWNWNILMKVSKYITTSIIGQMVYDDDILVPRKTEAFKDANGIVSYKTTSGKGIQLKNILGVGFSYKF